MKLLAMPKLGQVLESILAAMNLMYCRQFACIPFQAMTLTCEQTNVMCIGHWDIELSFINNR